METCAARNHSAPKLSKAVGLAMLGAAMALAACGDDGPVGDDGSGAAAGAGGGENAGGGGGASCSVPAEPVLVAPLVRITNTRAQAVYMNKCSSRFEVRIDGVLRAGELMSWHQKSCETVVQSGPPCCGCELPEQVIEAGASVDLQWTGLGYRESVVPEGCGEASGEECFLGSPATGAVEIVAHMFASGTNGGAYLSPTDPFDIEGSFEPGSASVYELIVE